jgi:cytochrome b
VRIKVWDPFVRLFHWSLVGAFVANAVFVPTASFLHLLFGYGIAVLVALRLIWGVVGRGYARFATFPPDARAATLQAADIATGRRRIHVGHTPLGGLMIYNLLLTLAVISVSGYMMTTITFWGIRWVKDLHEISVTWAEVSILIHVAAVIFESLRTSVNLPKAMVSGYKTIPESSQITK